MKTSILRWNQHVRNLCQARRTSAALAVVAGMVLAVSLGAARPPGRVMDWGYSAFGSPTNPIYGLSDVVAVGAGSVSGLALRSDGSIVGGSTLTVPPPVPPGLSNVLAISCGGDDGLDHNLALKSDGRVVAWGRNQYGQTNVPSWLSNVVAVSAGGYHSVALRRDGRVAAWGYNYYGQTDVDGLNNVAAIEAGDMHTLVLRSNGTVLAWGDNNYGQTSVPAGLSNVVALAAGGAHNLALRSDGTVVAWGGGQHNYGFYPEYGQSIIPAGLTNVIAVAAGYAHSMALRADGTVVSWGYNSAGQTNTPPGLSNVVFISTGSRTSVAVSAERVPITLDAGGPAPVISFHTFLGQQYSVQFSMDLGANNWTDLPGGQVHGDGHEVSVTDTAGTAGPWRFYRVVRTQKGREGKTKSRKPRQKK